MAVLGRSELSRIISRDRSIVIACDVGIDRFEEIVKATRDINEVGGYKIGALLGLSVGLPAVVRIARKHTDKPLIYDHQKAGTDIPEMGASFAKILKDAKINAVIIFPLAGPATQTAWIRSAQEEGIPVIVGAHMTHERYLAKDGGYIADNAVESIYKAAAHAKVGDFVVPGNQPDVIRKVREIVSNAGVKPVFYAPGFILQGGRIAEAAAAAGPWWHAIVGRAVYGAPDIHRAVVDLATEI